MLRHRALPNELLAASSLLFTRTSAADNATWEMEMTEWLRPERRAKLERQVAALAEEILSGQRGLVVSAQRMGKMLFWLGLDPNEDEDAGDFRLINSETDHLPLGDDRLYWDAGALLVKDLEIQSAEAWAREFGLAACQRLRSRFASP